MSFTIILLTHGKAGEALIKSSEMIAGPCKQLMAFSLEEGESPEKYMMKIKAYLDQMNYDILAMCDLYGGTPANVATILSSQYKMYCLSGLNLGMLLEAVMQSSLDEESDLQEFAQRLENTGKESCRLFGFEKEEIKHV